MTASTISFEPLVPASLFAFIAVVGAALLAVYALRRPGSVPRWRWRAIVAMMIGGFVLVLITLLNPALVRPLPGPAGKPMLTVLVDSSASMATADCAGGSGRFAAAAQIAANLASQLKDSYDIRVRSFADAPTAADAASLATKRP